MSVRRIIPYEGNEKYIFISYAHKNSAEVLEILGRMTDAGYRIWYDDGIAPGSEWPEYIADHLNRAAVVLAFVSPESIDSSNCRREVTYALSKQKPFLGVLLTPTKMSPGMEMQLSAQQCILRYTCRSEEDFYHRLLTGEILAPCRIIPEAKEEPEVSRADLAQREEAAAQAQPAAITDEDMKAVAQMASFPEASAGQPAAETPGTAQAPAKKEKPAKVRREKPAKQKPASPADGQGGKKKLPKWAIPAAALLVLIIALASCLGGDVKISDSKKVSRKTDFIIFTGDEITAETVQNMSKLKKLDSITMVDCNFQDADLGKLPTLGQFTSLTLQNCTGIPSFSFLSQMPNLRHLELVHCNVNNIPDISGCTQLTSVELTGLKGFTNLGYLPVSGLYTLILDGTAVADVSSLANATSLTKLSLADCPVKDASALTGLEELTSLNLSGTQVSSFADTFHCLKLEKLGVARTGLTDAKAFDNLTRLTELYLSGTQITEAACLTKSAATMKILGIADCPASDFWANVLPDCRNIKELDISGGTIFAGSTAGSFMTPDGQKAEEPRDLSVLAGMSGLEYLKAERCGLTSLDGLAGKSALSRLYLKDNALTDVSALDALADNAIVDLRYNNLVNVSTLPAAKYTMLALHGNAVDPATIPASENHSYIGITIEDSDDLIFADVVKNKKSQYFYIIGIPEDKKLQYKDVFGYGISYATEDFLNELLDEHGMHPYYWDDYGLQK
ncbi:MAG: TIR domain-containing protein [Lachnospiraceae bacterium]|nr:TIR domain-containing protein [Lachnospiraceae bacterium]